MDKSTEGMIVEMRSEGGVGAAGAVGSCGGNSFRPREQHLRGCCCRKEHCTLKELRQS